MKTIEIIELLGDGIGAELYDSLHAVSDVLPLDLQYVPFDLSLENRQTGGRFLFDQVVEAMQETRLAIKYPTVTRFSSPNAIIRRMCNFSVILRPVFSIKGIKTNFTEEVFLYIVRVATGGTYDDPGRTIGKDAAISIRIVERDPCRQAARFAFEFARRHGGMGVTSSSKHTIQRATDGLFQDIVEDVHREYKDIAYRVELFDALLARIILKPEDYQVILVLNEYGDFLSDMASGLIGSIGTGASGNFSFNEKDEVDIAMFDPAGGTAPDIAGRNLCNPTAILLAFCMLLDHIEEYDLGSKLRMAVLSAIADGACTGDIGGKLGTREFTAEVIGRMKEAGI